jgi:adenylate cyclase
LLAVAAVSAALYSLLPGVASLEDRAQDHLQAVAPTQSSPQDVVLVDIDEKSLQLVGPWPWPRPVLAALMRSIDSQGVRLQAWDLFLPEPASGDSALIEQMRVSQSPVVLGQVLVTDPAVSPAPVVGSRVGHSGAWPQQACASRFAVLGHLGVSPSLQDAKGIDLPVGHLSATPDSDGMLRRLPALLCEGQAFYPQLSLAAAASLGEKPAEIRMEPSILLGRVLGASSWLTVNGLRFPLNDRGEIFVPYARPHAMWPAVSAARVLDGSGAAALRGKLVLVGSTALGAGDKVATPFHPNAPGLSVHAELLGAAASGQWRMPVGQPAAVAAVMALTLAMLWIPMARRPRRGLILGLALGLVVVGPWVLAWFGLLANRLLPVFAPSLGLATAGIVLLLLQLENQRRQARRLASHLESVVPAALAREIAQQDPSGESLGRPGEGLVMAVQIRGLERWTSVMDSLRALALIHVLSSTADRIARASGGSLEHRQGDLLLLVFPGAQRAQQSVQGLLSNLHQAMASLLQVNETERCPLGLQFVAEFGPYLLAIAGGANSRRPLLLGPVVDNVVGIAALAPELASVVVLGPALAAQQPEDERKAYLSLGSYLLTDQSEPKPLFGIHLEPPAPRT